MYFQKKKEQFIGRIHQCLVALCLAVIITSLSLMQAQAADKIFTLKMSSPFPPFEHGTKTFLPYIAKEIEKVTEGRVKVTLYTSGSLGKAADHYDMVRKGIVDIGFSLPSFTSGLFPLNSVIELPFLGFQTGEEATRVLWKLYKKFPEMRAEYKGTKVLTLFTTDVTQIWTKKRRVHTISDLKGLRIRATGATTVKTLEFLGAHPITMVAPEIYTSLEKGVLDGVLFSAAGITGFKLQEIVKYGAIVNAGVFQFYLLMNEKKWNALPEDIRAKIDSVTGEKAGILAPRIAHDKAARAAYQVTKKFGVEIYTAPDEEIARWKAAVSPIYENWAKDRESKGLPGRAILNEIMRLTKKNISQ